MSGYLARDVRVGDTLEVLTPNGSFHTRLDGRAAPRLWSRLRPAAASRPSSRSCKAALRTMPESRVFLFYGNRTTARIMLLEELQALKDRIPQRLSLHFLFSGEPQEVELFNGRIDAARSASSLGSLFDARDVDEFFVCGPGDMNEQVPRACRHLVQSRPRGFTPNASPRGCAGAAQAAVESRRRPRPQAGVTTVTVLMDGRRRSFEMPRDGETVLEAGRAGGTRPAILLPRGRLLDLPHEGGEGRGRNGAELRPRAVGSRGGLRARLPVPADDATARSQLRRT